MPSRRAVLVSALAVATGGALTGCVAEHPIRPAGAAPSAPEASASPSPASGTLPTLMIIRHAEKPADDGAPFGILPTGEQDPESLTVQGWSRAGALVELFTPAGPAGWQAPRAGLARPVRLLAANPGRGSKRPFQTVTPVGTRLGITPDTAFAKGQERELAGALTAATAATLVAWEHEAIPKILAALGTITPAPPSRWPDDRFDLVWCFTRQRDGWGFTQVPQLLLAGDSPHPA